MTFLWIILGVVYVACWIYFGLSTFRKGHYWLFWIGFFFPFLWIIGAFDQADATRRRPHGIAAILCTHAAPDPPLEGRIRFILGIQLGAARESEFRAARSGARAGAALGSVLMEALVLGRATGRRSRAALMSLGPQ